VSVEQGALKPVAQVLGSHIAGALAISAKGIAVVPLIYDNKLAVVDLTGARPTVRADTGIAPFGAAINAEATVAYVSNWGGRLPKPGDLTAPAGMSADADQVVVDERGIASTGTVTRVDLAAAKATHTIPVELHPTAVRWDEARNRLYVANGNKDSISVIDTGANRVERTFELQPFSQKAFGIAPTALAISSDGKKLYAALGGINAVAVVDTTNGRIEGLIPTAWYPNGLAISSDGRRLAIASLLGAGSGWAQEPRKRFVHSYRGSVSVVDVPDAAQLASYTTAVA
jgi:YVTN family beta-propeller protein